jgi:hypothetical protein
VKRALALVAVVTGVLAASALARTPLPSKAQGSGAEPTAGGGIVAGAPFAARSAIARYDTASGDIYVYLFKRQAGCHLVSFSDAPYVWVWIHTEGTPLDVGRPMRTSGTTRFAQVNFVLADHYVAVQPGVRLTFTRVDPAKGSLWHGRLVVARTTYKGKVFSYNGTFAARWCR